MTRSEKTMQSRVFTSAAIVLLTLAAGPALAAGFQPRAEEADWTALDRYVADPDPAYRWEIIDSRSRDGWTSYTLDMVSQTWRSEEEVDRTEWQHHLIVTVPDEIEQDTAFLLIGGGDNGDAPPRVPNLTVIDMARDYGMVSAELRQVPNQPLYFKDEDDRRRVEDSIIAYTWDRYMRTGDERWPLRLPMTKAAVRAMDTIEALLAQERSHTVADFVVAGGSKRGWTTWTTAIVDARVRACIPIVINMLNLIPSFRHHKAVYGFWAPAVDDYEDEQIMARMETPEFARLLELVEPYPYRERLTMPKLILNATGDQFFVPESEQFYWDELPGPKVLRYVPNTGHNMGGSDAPDTVKAFTAWVLAGRALPEITWRLEQPYVMEMSAEPAPDAVHLWEAFAPNQRDFRIDQLGPEWQSRELEAEDGDYRGRVRPTQAGWRAFFIEATWEGVGEDALKLTTPVQVIPESTPFVYVPEDPDIPGFLDDGK